MELNRRIIILFILFIIMILIVYMKTVNDDVNMEGFFVMIRSHVSGNKYDVQDELPNPQTAADKLGAIDMFINNFISYLDSKYVSDDRVKRLVSRSNGLVIKETNHDSSESSFTVNKGEMMSVCVRSKDNAAKFHDMQLMKFVIIHELAHIASLSFGHNDEFNRNFNWLLHEAQNVGYTPVDYSVNPVTYCGVRVTNNPIM